jgi:hypothetical protein
MDTLDKLFALQKSLSGDLTKIQKELNSAKSPAAKLLLKTKFAVIKRVHEQVSDISIPY